MKKVISEQTKRIIEIISRMDDRGVITELNVKYMNMLLDKISSTGMESLSNYEKDALQKLSNGEDVNPPEIHSLGTTQTTLRFTGVDAQSGDPMVNPEDNGKTFGEPQHTAAYLRGEAQNVAGFDQPIFIDGDLTQLDRPEEEQEIRMILPQGEYECVARTEDNEGIPTYSIMLKSDEDEGMNLMEQFIDQDAPSPDDFDIGEMENYNIAEQEMINNLEEPGDDLRNYELGEGDYSKAKKSLLASKSISKEMKETILKYFTGGATYHEGGRVHGLSKPNVLREKSKKISGCSMGADKNGFYVYTHRARSNSKATPDKITVTEINFIESTG